MTVFPTRITNWWDHFYKIRYYILLTAIFAMIIMPALTPEKNEGFFWTLGRTGLLLACLNVLRDMKKGLLTAVILGLIVASTDWFSIIDDGDKLASLISLVFFGIFIGLISYEVFRQVLRARSVDMHIIIGAFCGFLLIGLITMVCFTFFHLKDPDSFTNVTPGAAGIDDILYFSYITILTIGYGDITPLTEETRRIALFFGLIGQFYLVVIMAVLVGKFIGSPNSNDAVNPE